MEFDFFIGLIVLAILLGVAYVTVLFATNGASKLEIRVSTFLLFLLLLGTVFMLLGLSSNQRDFYDRLDPMEEGYSPLAKKHLLTYLIFTGLSSIGAFRCWVFGRKQAPLALVFWLACMLIDMVLQVLLIIQLSDRQEENYSFSGSDGHGMLLGPLMFLIISAILIVKVVYAEANLAAERSYKNALLNALNEFLLRSQRLTPWVFLALIPVFVLITLVLVLFGQDADSFVRVFTETSTWKLSQQAHPPFLDHQGHYLCTVAACGSPRLVKPLRIGTRHGTDIIVNRQLLVANAFEDILQRKFPRFHAFVRRNYDRYGYPLSKDINSPLKSNITYVLMKPLEWVFLLVIYASCERPEKLIAAQYAKR